MSRRRRIALIAAVPASAIIIAVVAVATLGGTSGGSLSLTSPQKVFCGEVSDRASVVEAGIVLGSLNERSSINAPQSSTRSFSSYDNWQSAEPEAFADACRNAISALQMASSSSSGGGGSLPYESLIGVAVGAILTLLSSELVAARDRRKARGDEMRDAIVEFDAAALKYISKWQVLTVNTPSLEDLSSKSAGLAALLAQALRTVDTHQGQDVRTRLTALTEKLEPNNWPTTRAERDWFTGQVRNELQKLVQDLQQYSRLYERWNHPRDRKARTQPVSITP